MMECGYCKKFPSHHTCMLHYVLKIPHSLAPCIGVSSHLYVSFDKFIKLISFINFTGKIPSKFHMQYLKLCNDAKEKSGTKKWAAHDEMLHVSDSQSNALSTLASSKSHIN